MVLDKGFMMAQRGTCESVNTNRTRLKTIMKISYHRLAADETLNLEFCRVDAGMFLRIVLCVVDSYLDSVCLALFGNCEGS